LIELLRAAAAKDSRSFTHKCEQILVPLQLCRHY